MSGWAHLSARCGSRPPIGISICCVSCPEMRCGVAWRPLAVPNERLGGAFLRQFLRSARVKKLYFRVPRFCVTKPEKSVMLQFQKNEQHGARMYGARMHSHKWGYRVSAEANCSSGAPTRRDTRNSVRCPCGTWKEQRSCAYHSNHLLYFSDVPSCL